MSPDVVFLGAITIILIAWTIVDDVRELYREKKARASKSLYVEQ